MNRREAAEVLEELKKPGRFTILDTGGAYEALQMAIDALGKDNDVPDRNVGDMISRQAAIDIFDDYNVSVENGELEAYSRDRKRLCNLPSAQPTLYGYNIGHLELIAQVLRKENLPPERVAEALMDIGRIVAIVTDEFEETLRKSVEQSMDFAVGEERRTNG